MYPKTIPIQVENSTLIIPPYISPSVTNLITCENANINADEIIAILYPFF